MYKILLLAFFCVWVWAGSAKADLPELRIGVLKFGTVNWELQTIKSQKLDHANGFDLKILPFAGKQATSTALHGGAVDVIVNDWLWVSRQRFEGRNYSFIPYATIVGGMIVKDDIQKLSDLKDKKLGVAGGPTDKNWLLIQAYSKKDLGFDLAAEADIVFGAPPLLSKKLENGELDGVVNFWHYLAKLEAAGFKRLVDIKTVLSKLGLKQDIPMIGYVFSPDILKRKPALVDALAAASRQAKHILQQEKGAWDKIRDLIPSTNDNEFAHLKAGFLKGIPNKWDQESRQNAQALFSVLAKSGGSSLIGKQKALQEDTFVPSVQY